MPVKCITCNLKRANFNLPEQKKGLYCGDCKKPNFLCLARRSARPATANRDPTYIKQIITITFEFSIILHPLHL